MDRIQWDGSAIEHSYFIYQICHIIYMYIYIYIYTHIHIFSDILFFI